LKMFSKESTEYFLSLSDQFTDIVPPPLVNARKTALNTYTKFDVIVQKFETVFVARGIVFLKPDDGVLALNDHRRWRLLREGRSEDGVLEAMEDLWNKMQAMDTKDPVMKGNEA
jgi:hypothetical protein